MIIKVDRCIGIFRININSNREFIRNKDNDMWNNSHAKEALDILEKLYGLKRKNIRFKVS